MSALPLPSYDPNQPAQARAQPPHGRRVRRRKRETPSANMVVERYRAWQVLAAVAVACLAVWITIRVIESHGGGP